MTKRIKAKDVDSIVEVISVLVKSPKLETYCVGITMDAKRRRSQYKNYSVPKPWPHMIFLAFELDQSQALDLEKAVFEACTDGDKRKQLYTKYASDLRDKNHRPSTGGRPNDPKTTYCLYVSWCNAD